MTKDELAGVLKFNGYDYTRVSVLIDQKDYPHHVSWHRIAFVVVVGDTTWWLVPLGWQGERETVFRALSPRLKSEYTFIRTVFSVEELKAVLREMEQ